MELNIENMKMEKMMINGVEVFIIDRGFESRRKANKKYWEKNKELILEKQRKSKKEKRDSDLDYKKKLNEKAKAYYHLKKQRLLENPPTTTKITDFFEN